MTSFLNLPCKPVILKSASVILASKPPFGLGHWELGWVARPLFELCCWFVITPFLRASLPLAISLSLLCLASDKASSPDPYQPAVASLWKGELILFFFFPTVYFKDTDNLITEKFRLVEWIAGFMLQKMSLSSQGQKYSLWKGATTPAAQR